MPNTFPELQDFKFTPNNSYGFFSLQLNLNKCYQFNIKLSTFAAKKCSGWLLSATTSKTYASLECVAENDIEMSERCRDIMHES